MSPKSSDPSFDGIVHVKNLIRRLNVDCFRAVTRKAEDMKWWDPYLPAVFTMAFTKIMRRSVEVDKADLKQIESCLTNQDGSNH